MSIVKALSNIHIFLKDSEGWKEKDGVYAQFVCL